MTSIYFVRHAQPVHSWEDDRSRPLTPDGLADSEQVTELFKSIQVDNIYSSPYKRSMDTISGCAEFFKLPVLTDERLRERRKGKDGNAYGMFQKRWADFAYCEDGGESIGETQLRNIEFMNEVLFKHNNENIVVGTHGTALSAILNYYNPNFGCDDFIRIIDYMPYVIRLDFDFDQYVGQQELLIIEKEFTGTNRADKR